MQSAPPATDAVEHGAITPSHETASSKAGLVSGLISGLRKRFDSVPPWVLLVELFFGIGWIRAGTDKLVSPAWWRGDVIDQFLASTTDAGLPWYQWFSSEFLEQNVVVLTVVVVGLELAIGAAFVVGRRVVPALVAGILLSLAFVAAGTVNPGVFYVVAQTVLLLWILEHRVRAVWGIRLLSAGRVASILLVLASAPFVSNVAPDRVVEDAAAVMAFFGLLMVASTTAGINQLAARSVSSVDLSDR